MKNMMNRVCSKVQSAAENMDICCRKIHAAASCKLTDCTGDLATNTIGAIIVAVVIVGLLVAAANAFFPGFFTEMFNAMKTKLSSNW